MERHHSWWLHRWFACSARRAKSNTKRCDRVRDLAGGDRRSGDRISEDDGREHEARYATAAAKSAGGWVGQ